MKGQLYGLRFLGVWGDERLGDHSLDREGDIGPALSILRLVEDAPAVRRLLLFQRVISVRLIECSDFVVYMTGMTDRECVTHLVMTVIQRVVELGTDFCQLCHW